MPHSLHTDVASPSRMTESPAHSNAPPFALTRRDAHDAAPVRRSLRDRALGAVERVCRLDAINDIHARVIARGPLEPGPAGVREFLHRTLDVMNVRFRLPRQDLER